MEPLKSELGEWTTVSQLKALLDSCGSGTVCVDIQRFRGGTVRSSLVVLDENTNDGKIVLSKERTFI